MRAFRKALEKFLDKVPAWSLSLIGLGLIGVISFAYVGFQSEFPRLADSVVFYGSLLLAIAVGAPLLLFLGMWLWFGFTKLSDPESQRDFLLQLLLVIAIMAIYAFFK